MKITLACALACLLNLAPAAQAQIYKWVDENGVTHYGSQPPADKAAQAVRATGSTTPAPRKPVPAAAQEMAEGVASALMQGEPDAKTLNCAKAVSSGRDGIDSMLEVGLRNVQGGYMDRTEYENNARLLRAERAKLSEAACEASTGSTRGFYLCLSNPNNHVMACGKRHRPK